MNLIVPTKQAPDGFFSFQNVRSGSAVSISNKLSRTPCSSRVFVGCKGPVLVLSDSFWCRAHDGYQKHRRKQRVVAVSEVEHHSSNGRLNGVQKISYGNLNGGDSSSSFEEFESKNHLRRLVRNGELEEGFRLLENMVYRGDIPDIIACTSLIRGFCKSGKTRKATQIMNILEESGAVLDVITYNVLISGYCRVGEIDNALRVLDRMSVSPDVVTVKIIDVNELKIEDDTKLQT